MGRKFFAVIDLDEAVASDYAETNGLGDAAPGEYLEREFGWLEQSGISLDHWMITDEDDELKWARYINYLIQWALDHSGEEYAGMSPPCYDEWSECEDAIDAVHTYRVYYSESREGFIDVFACSVEEAKERYCEAHRMGLLTYDDAVGEIDAVARLDKYDDLGAASARLCEGAE